MLSVRPGWTVIGEASNGREAVEAARILKPDLVIADITMPLLNGLEAIPKMLKVAPSARILILSMHDEEQLIYRALDEGASGFVLKSDAEQCLYEAIEAVIGGKRFVSPSVASLVRQRRQLRLTSTAAFSHEPFLTGREQEVVQLLAEGFSNKQVADLLSISVRTAENHRARLSRKLGVKSLSALVRYAIRNHIIDA
jgi:DNA-binding NarL/FixJ family response regulator